MVIQVINIAKILRLSGTTTISHLEAAVIKSSAVLEPY